MADKRPFRKRILDFADEFERMQERVGLLSVECDDLKKKLSLSSAAESSFSSTKDQLQGRVQQLELRLAEGAGVASKELQAKMAEEHARRKALEAEYRELKKRMESLSQLTRERDALEADNQELKSRVGSLAEEASRCRQLEAENKQLQSRVASLSDEASLLSLPDLGLDNVGSDIFEKSKSAETDLARSGYTSPLLLPPKLTVNGAGERPSPSPGFQARHEPGDPSASSAKAAKPKKEKKEKKRKEDKDANEAMEDERAKAAEVAKKERKKRKEKAKENEKDKEQEREKEKPSKKKKKIREDSSDASGSDASESDSEGSDSEGSGSESDAGSDSYSQSSSDSKSGSGSGRSRKRRRRRRRNRSVSADGSKRRRRRRHRRRRRSRSRSRSGSYSASGSRPRVRRDRGPGPGKYGCGDHRTDLDVFIRRNELEARVAGALRSMAEADQKKVMGTDGGENSYILIDRVKNPNGVVMSRIRKLEKEVAMAKEIM